MYLGAQEVRNWLGVKKDREPTQEEELYRKEPKEVCTCRLGDKSRLGSGHELPEMKQRQGPKQQGAPKKWEWSVTPQAGRTKDKRPPTCLSQRVTGDQLQ